MHGWLPIHAHLRRWPLRWNRVESAPHGTKTPRSFLRQRPTEMIALLRQPNLLSHALFGVSIALFIASLAQPAYVTTAGHDSHLHYGFEALLLGPIGFFAGHFAWVANPLLWMRAGT